METIMGKVVNKAKLTPGDWEKIVLNDVFGKQASEIADMIGVTEHAIKRVIRVSRLVKEQDWKNVITVIRVNNVSKDLISWSAEKCGIEIPEDVSDQIEEEYRRWREKDQMRERDRRATPAQQPEPEPPKTEMDQNEKIFIAETLKNLRQNTEMWETLMDVVIPKYMNDLKDNLNVNFDLISQRVANIEKNVETIAHNTRKRGM